MKREVGQWIDHSMTIILMSPTDTDEITQTESNAKKHGQHSFWHRKSHKRIGATEGFPAISAENVW